MKKSIRKAVGVVLAASMMFTSAFADTDFVDVAEDTAVEEAAVEEAADEAVEAEEVAEDADADEAEEVADDAEADDEVEAYATSSDYAFVPSADIDADAEAFSNDDVTITATQKNSFKAGAEEVALGDSTFVEYTQTNSKNTTLAVDGDKASAYRLAYKVTAKKDVTVSIAHKVTSGKANYLLKDVEITGTDSNGNPSGTASKVDFKSNDGADSIYDVFETELKAGESVWVAGKGSNIVIYGINAVSTSDDAETTTETTTAVATTDATTETTTKATSSDSTDAAKTSYDFVASAAASAGETLYKGSKATVEASQKLAYTSKDNAADKVGDNTYSQWLQTSSENTTLTVNGATKAYRVAAKITAIQDTTIKIDHKVGAGKTNYILKGDVKEGGTAEVVDSKENTGDSSIYETFTVDLKAGDVVYFAGQGTNPVFYAIDGLDGSDSSSSDETTTEATTVTTTVATTTEATTEVTTDAATEADYTGKLVYKTVSEKSNYALADGTLHVDFKLDQSFMDKDTFKGLNNTTFYITYNPDVVRAKTATKGDVKGLTADDEYQTFITKSAVQGQIDLTPSSDNEDYAGMGADGTKTAAELGKIKMSAAFMVQQTPAVVVTDGEILFGIDFDIISEGDANIKIVGVNNGDIAAMGRPTDVDADGNQIKYATAFDGQTITVGEAETTTEVSTESTTESTTTTTTESTTTSGNSGNDDKVTESTTETTTEAATESTTEAATESTTETVVDNSYDFVPTGAVSAAGEVLFTGTKATVEAVQALKYNTTAKPDTVGENSYANNLQTNSVDTNLTVNGETKAYRVALKITASEDTVIKIDHKVGSGKTNYILKGDVVDGGTAEVVASKENTGDASIYETFEFTLAAGETVYFAGQGTNPVVYAVDGLNGNAGTGSGDNATTTTTTTTTEATTEATTETPLGEGEVGLKAVESQNRTSIVNGEAKEVTVNYVLKGNNKNGVNSYTFFINYNPEVLEFEEIASVDGRIAVKSTLEKAFKLVPAKDNPDYKTADGTKTAAQLGRVKVAYVASIENADNVNFKSETDDDIIMFSVKYKVLKGNVAGDTNTYDSEIGVQLVGTGFQSSPAAMAAGNVTKGVALESELKFVPDKTTTTTVAPTPTPDDSTSTTETTTVDTDTETTTVAPTPGVDTTTTTTTTVTTDATTETTTVRHSSGGGGGGGSTRKTTTTTTQATTEAATEATTKTYVDVNGNAFGLHIPTEYVRGDHHFIDLGDYGWAEEAINNLYRLGIINGTSDDTYSPALGCKRGDFAIIINNMLGLDLEPTKNFDDNADPSKYYYNACRVGYTAGILSGYGDNNYKPEKYCSREEMFVLVAKTLEFLGEDVTSTDLSVNDKYNDVESISWWSAPYCAYLTDIGIIRGTDLGNADPKRDINRAEMAVMMYKDYQYILNKYGESLEQAAEDVTSDEESVDTTAEGDETTVEESTEETTAAVVYGRGKTKIRVNSDATTTTDSSDEEETEE